MRIRNAALAGATAIAVAFGGTTVASATEAKDTTNVSLSSKICAALEKDQNADGQAIFGSSKSEHGDANETGEYETLSSQPAWAKALYAATIIGGVGALLGGIIGPVYNFIVHGPFSR